ncbi:hypothetical protein GGR51DRAFT_511021 [Nemania sp. FL0031]|nr:hypothetical protein GGR51DRAFT_511021 [Nemania sp. FL0031]
MPQHSVESSTHGEEEIDPLESIHSTGNDGYGSDVIKKQQLTLTSGNDNQDIAMPEPAISLATTQNDDTSDSDVSYSSTASASDATAPSTPDPSTDAACTTRPDHSKFTWEIPDEFLDDFRSDSDFDSDDLDEDSDWETHFPNDDSPKVTQDMSVDDDDGYSSDISWSSSEGDDPKSGFYMGSCHSRRKFFFPTRRNLSTIISLEGKQSSPDYNHMAAAASNSRLERLPPELRIKILSNMPDLGALHAIIHASPVLYAQYSYDRNRILAACMEREFEGFFADAYANLQCRTGEMKSNYEVSDSCCSNTHSYKYDKKRTFRFLNAYKNWLEAPDSSPGPASLSPKRLRWMIAYHMSIARPLVRQYSSWALRNLRQAAGPKTDTTDGAHDNKLSRSEEIRIFRALYRHDTYLHTIGPRDRQSDTPKRIRKKFFGLFGPWEVDAIDCMSPFLEQLWNEFFDRIQDDMEPDKFELRNGYWNPGVEIELRTERQKHVDCMMARGLETLAHMTRIEDYPTLLSTSDRYLQCLGGHHSSTAYDIRFNGFSQFQKYVPGDPVRFLGDLLPPNGPPLAWIRLRKGKYGDYYHRPKVPEPLKRWGFAMWDAKRFADTGSEGLITEELGHPVCVD